jgi:seryl-tRNA synthetase
MDINLIREKPEVVKESQKRRFKSGCLVDLVVSLDATWKKMYGELNHARAELNKIQSEITEKKKAKQPVPEELIANLKKKKSEIEREEKVEADLKKLLDEKLSLIGNIVHSSVPVSNDEADNGIVKTWGECKPKDPKLRPHHELLYMIDGYDPEAGANVAGHRGYFLKGPGVILNQALINFGLKFLNDRAYTLLQTPYFMNKEIMARTAQLSDFDEQHYKVSSDSNDEKYLIATSEQPISALHMGEWMENLPRKYAGYSTNFRKEAGGHGRDVWGIFRVHQFEKIEQFVITDPEKSWEMHEEMLKTAEDFLQALGLPYRVVNIVSGELNDAAAKKYDIECFFPGMQDYRELVSCSNCTDYQSRRLEIRAGFKKEGETKKYVHMLNSTLCATSRAICCILENNQTEEGIKIPEALHPYTFGLTFLPFKKEAPKPKEAPKAQKK